MAVANRTHRPGRSVGSDTDVLRCAGEGGSRNRRHECSTQVAEASRLRIRSGRKVPTTARGASASAGFWRAPGPCQPTADRHSRVEAAAWRASAQLPAGSPQKGLGTSEPCPPRCRCGTGCRGYAPLLPPCHLPRGAEAAASVPSLRRGRRACPGWRALVGRQPGRVTTRAVTHARGPPVMGLYPGLPRGGRTGLESAGLEGGGGLV